MIAKSYNRCRGFTLVEVMIAVAVLGAAMIAVANMFQVGADINSSEEKRMIALNLLQHELEMLKEKDWNTIQNKSRRAVDGYADYEVALSVSNYGSITKLVQGTIYWTGYRGLVQSETLECIYADHSYRVEPSYKGAL